MKGQWKGSFTGYSSGDMTIEIDEFENDYSGRACIFENGNSHFIYVLQFRTGDKRTTQKLSLPIQFQRIGDTTAISRGELTKAFPKITFPDRAEITLQLTQKGLRAAGTTYLDSQKIGGLTALLTSGSADKRSKIFADRKIKSWDKFKLMVGRLPPNKYIFRGQPVCKRLRTSFHRTNRRDLNRFMANDIPQLHAIVTSKTNHYFDLRDNIQNAAFWNLLQHHGYPTPLLDWTYSPYVAAYFAFREKAVLQSELKPKIRIFMFDRAEWENDFPQFNAVVNVRPHFSMLNPVALENPRALPQQAVCSITTVDDVEDYLEHCGQLRKKTYLKVFELPYTDRGSVLAELRLMGVAAGSLFPGIDGACEEMRLRNFET